MEYKSLFVIYAAVLLILCLGLFVLPGPFIEIYGATLEAPELSIARFFGVSMLGAGRREIALHQMQLKV